MAALGTGDKLSVAENAAYGLPLYAPDERRAMLEATWRALHDTMPVWFGAGATATNDLARSLGATLNLWDVAPDDVAREIHTRPVELGGSSTRESRRAPRRP